jgi:hypothetical protein
MLDAVLFKNMKSAADVLVREALAGQHWAVTFMLKDQMPGRPRKVSDPAERPPPPTTVQEAAQRIADIVARMEGGEIDLDEGQTLIHGLQAYAEARKTQELEAEVERLRETVAKLQAKVENGGMKRRRSTLD